MVRLRTAILGVFLVQVATGLVLMTAYSPSAASAWGSVWYIQTQVPGGWLVRGIHHFASDAFIVLLVIAAAQWLWSGAYVGPGWRVWWILLIGLGLALALSLTGHLLRWDQEGFWGTTVRMNILARAPVIGESLRRLLVGGSELGTLTLTRFYTLHVIVLPFILAWSLRHLRGNVASPLAGDGAQSRDRKGAGFFSSAAWLGVIMLLVLAVVLATRTTDLLGAPADRSATDYPARPEWHTLFLFQWLKAFQGPTSEIIASIFIPSVTVLAFAALPFLHRIVNPQTAHRLARAFASAMLVGILLLTAAALWADRDPSDAKIRADRDARRALQLAADEGIPPEGPLALLARDPLTQGPRLFAAHCASCHRFDGRDGRGTVPLDPPTSSDLAGFATRGWIRGLLRNPMDDRYFGRMRTPEGEPAHTKMSRLVTELMEGADDESRRQLEADFAAAAAFLAQESTSPSRGRQPADTNASILDQGREVFQNVCNECHSYDGQRTGTTHAPEMKGYGSVEWIELMIAEPDHESRYRSAGRERARMPRFKERLSDVERRLIAEWLANAR